MEAAELLGYTTSAASLVAYGQQVFSVCPAAGCGEFPAFPVGALVRKGKLLLYAGAGDKYVILLSCNLGGLVDYLWEYCRLNCR